MNWLSLFTLLTSAIRQFSETMKTWEASAVRDSFEFTANKANQYAHELKERIRRDPKRDSQILRETHDEHLAKWFVYDSLSGCTSLGTREALVAKLKANLANPSDLKGVGQFSKEDFENYWRRHMQNLLKKYEVT
jgi:hypothetical protein